jgi:hypothetical protein
MPCTLFEEPFFLPSISLERTFQVLFGENRKSMSGDCFSVLVILILHKFDLALHASLMMFFPYSMFLLFLIKKKKKIGGENARSFIFSFIGMLNIACIFA